MERQIRKHQNTLIVIGTGILLFALWTVVKTIATYNITLADRFDPFVGTIILISFIAALCVDILLRVFTGLKARSAGFKKNGSLSFVFTAAVLIILHILGIAFYLYSVPVTFESLVDTIVTCVIEGTGIFMTVDLIYSGIKLRKLLLSAEGQVS